MKNHIDAAIALLGGLQKTAEICGISFVSVHKWMKCGHFPATEYLPDEHPRKTHYAEAIEAATNGAITKAELLSYVPLQP